MPGFLYFLPDTSAAQLAPHNQVSGAVFSRYGLSAVLGDIRSVPDDAVILDGPGPNNLTGATVYPKPPAGSDPVNWRYSADVQQWRDVGGWWLGWETDRPPAPEDLQRRQVYSDYRVKDPRGREWMVPAARMSGRDVIGSVPVEYGFSGGEVQTHMPERFAHLWDLSGQVSDHFSGAQQQSESWQVRAALTVLQVNYRLGEPHVDALRESGLPVLTRDTVFTTLFCLIDGKLEDEYLKKSSGNGQESHQEPAAHGLSVHSPGAAE